MIPSYGNVLFRVKLVDRNSSMDESNHQKTSGLFD